ncbi:MAG: hypothetical protein AAF206_05510 [Bacteroidota bacterium]
MNRRFALILCSILCCAQLSAQQSLSLTEALSQKLVQIAVKGNGGYRGACLNLGLKNLTGKYLEIEIPAGQLFASKDTSIQDLMVTEDAMLVLGPRQVKRRNLTTMCTQASNASPSEGEAFSFGKMAQGHLLKLAQNISQNGYQNSTAQSAVWSVANRESIRNIYGQDTTMVRNLASIVSEATGHPIREFILRPRRHHITSIRTSMEVYAPKSYSNASLALFDAEGEVVRTYFVNRIIEKGFVQYRLGASHTRGDSAKLYLRLESEGRLIMEKLVQAGDSIVPLMHLDQQAIMVYDIPRDTKADIGVYDGEGRPIMMLAENKKVYQGSHRGTYIASVHVPREQTYYMQITDQQGNLIDRKILDPQAEKETVFPKELERGVFAFELKQPVRNAKIAIYDDAGRLKRNLYDINVLQPGAKRIKYAFEHVRGPEARFYIRLLDQDEKILREKCIGCQ